MNTDAELLRRFVEEHADAAFAELVRRHLALVRTTALRRVGGDPHAADDVTQQIFVALARKASALRGHANLAGWLYLGTHHATADWVRREQRRKQREAAAHSMQLNESSPDHSAAAAPLRPWLDDALVALKPDEREAIVLRFFSGHTFAEIGATLALSEEAARKRVDRALEKLHAVLIRRGVTSTVAALGSALTAAGAGPVPVGLAAQVAGTALTSAAAPGVVAALAGALWPALAAATLVGGTLAIVPQHRANTAAAAVIATREVDLHVAIAATRAGNRRLEREIDQARTAAARPPVRPAARPATVRPATAPVASRAAPPAGVPLSVSPEGVVLWRGDPVRLDEFLVLMMDHKASVRAGESRFSIQAPGARFRQLNWVLDEARKAGIDHLVIESDAAPVGPMNTWF